VEILDYVKVRLRPNKGRMELIESGDVVKINKKTIWVRLHINNKAIKRRMHDILH
jgi:uncharacterized protein YlbG (UPF0298 family)